MDDLAMAFKKKEYLPSQEGEVIAKVGDPVKHFYIIEKGEVGMQVLGDDDIGNSRASASTTSHGDRTRDSNNTIILPNAASPSHKMKHSMSQTATASVFIKSRGEFVGVGFFKATKQQKKWNVSILATAAGCTMWYMPKQAYEDFIDLHPNIHQSMLDSVGLSMEPELKTIDVFSGMSEVKREILASLFRYSVLKSGKTLFKECDIATAKGHSLYFISQGTATVHAEVEGEDKHLADLRAGHFFGELGLLIGIPRTATVKAKSLCLMLELNQVDFRKFAAVCPEVLQRFKDRIDTYQINLSHWLYNSHVMSYFIAFCKREFTTELLEFWRACQAFNDLGYHLTHKTQGEKEWEGYRLTLWASIDTLMRLSDEQKTVLRDTLEVEIVSPRKIPITIEDGEDPPTFMRYKKVKAGVVLDQQAQKELMVLGDLMADHYIRPSASKQVNVSAQVAKHITSALDEKRIDLSMFEEAEANVRGLMKRNSWKRFESDPTFSECLNAWYEVNRSEVPDTMQLLRQMSEGATVETECDEEKAAMANQLTAPRSR